MKQCALYGQLANNSTLSTPYSQNDIQTPYNSAVAISYLLYHVQITPWELFYMLNFHFISNGFIDHKNIFNLRSFLQYLSSRH